MRKLNDMNHLKYLLSVLLFGFATLAQSQTYIGFQTGYTKASEDYGDVQLPEGATTHIHGVLVGMIVRREFGRVYIDIEPQYRKRGAACIPNWTVFTGNEEFYLNYFELPMTLGFKAVKINKVEIAPRLGFSVAYYLNGNSITYSGVGDSRVSESRPLDKANFNSMDHTFHFGIQTGYLLNDKTTLLGTINHSRGLVNTVKIVTSKHRSIDLS